MFRTVNIGVIVLLALLACYLKLGWLSAGILGIGAVHIAYSSDLRLFLRIRKHFVLHALISVAFVFITVILLRLFIIEVYRVGSDSMEGTLKEGDRLLVSKLNYGPRPPGSLREVPWLNVLTLFRRDHYEPWGNNNYHRWRGIDSVKAGDIVVFTSTDNSREALIKRCVATGGDSLRILNGTVYLNGRLSPSEHAVLHQNRVWYNNKDLLTRSLDSLQVTYFANDFMDERPPSVILMLHSALETSLRASPGVDSITRVMATAEAYPMDSTLGWTYDNMGPFRVPARGIRIQLNRPNWALYKDVIRRYEKQDMTERSGRFFLAGKEVFEFVFMNNYLFVLGDNRPVSVDSRQFGFVPEANIIGESVFLLFRPQEQ